MLISSLELPTHYGRWLKRQFDPADLANQALEAAVWGVGADLDGDGLSTLVEYYMRLDPDDPDAAGAITGGFAAPGVLELCYRKSKDPNLTATCEAEWSEQLLTWKKSGELHSNGNPVNIVLQPPVDRGSHVVVCARTNVGAFPGLYLRVLVRN